MFWERNGLTWDFYCVTFISSINTVIRKSKCSEAYRELSAGGRQLLRIAELAFEWLPEKQVFD